MTYEEFKKELRKIITNQNDIKNKKILFLEKRKTLFDKESINLIKNINYFRFGIKSILLSDELLCMLWFEGDNKRYKYWLLEELYQKYLKVGWNEVIPGIIFTLLDKSSMCNSYDKNRERFIVKPFNCQMYYRELDDGVYWNIGENFALVLYELIYDTSDERSMVKVGHDMTDKWGISQKAILWDALLNTSTKMPPRLFHGDDDSYLHQNNEGIFMPWDGKMNIQINGNDRKEREIGYRLTTAQRQGGAIALFYPGVKERIAEMVGDYYVGFLSVDEVLIYPVRKNVRTELKKKVQSVNVRLDERQTLSYSVYRYNAARKELIEV